MSASPAEGVVYLTIRRGKDDKVAATRVTKTCPILRPADVVLKLQLRVPDPVFRWFLDTAQDNLLQYLKGVEVVACS